MDKKCVLIINGHLGDGRPFICADGRTKLVMMSITKWWVIDTILEIQVDWELSMFN